MKAKLSTTSPELQPLVDDVNAAMLNGKDITEAVKAVGTKDEEKFLTRLEKFLDEDFKTAVEDGSEEEIRALISKTAIAEYENQVAKKNDVDLQEKKAAAKYAGEVYSDNTKVNKARISYAYYILSSRGKE